MQRIAMTDRRTALFAAAVRVIARLGITGATTRAIVAEADMPLASFHYAFASRGAMLTELVESILAEQRAAITDALVEADSAAAYIERAFEAYFERMILEPEIELALQELVGWSRTVPTLGDLPRMIYAGYAESILSLVEAVRDRFGVVWREPEVDVARFVMVVTDGVVALWLVDRDDERGRRMLGFAAAAVRTMAVGA